MYGHKQGDDPLGSHLSSPPLTNLYFILVGGCIRLMDMHFHWIRIHRKVTLDNKSEINSYKVLIARILLA